MQIVRYTCPTKKVAKTILGETAFQHVYKAQMIGLEVTVWYLSKNEIDEERLKVLGVTRRGVCTPDNCDNE